MWAEDNLKNYPYLLINPITDANGNTAPGGGVTRKVQEFTSTGTFTVPSNCSSVEVLVVGGGGAGGGGRGSSTVSSPGMGLGGGGGGGVVRQEIVSVTPGASYTVTVGAGGSGANGQNNSTAGGNSSFGSLVVANGGGAGASMDYTRGSGSTAYRANIVGGTTGGDSSTGTDMTQSGGLGGGAGGAPVFTFYNTTGVPNAYSGYSNYTQPVPTQAFGGSGVLYNVIGRPGQGVGIYGWGAMGCSPYDAFGALSAGTAGTPAYGLYEGVTNPYTRVGGAGTANTGSAGAGSGGYGSSGAAGNATGGNGGSGFVRVIYWS